MIAKALFGHSSQSIVAGQLLCIPLGRCLFRQDNGLQDILVRRGKRIEVGLKGDFAPWNVAIAGNLGGNHRVAHIGDLLDVGMDAMGRVSVSTNE